MVLLWHVKFSILEPLDLSNYELIPSFLSRNLESFLTDSFDSVWSCRVRFYIDFINYHTFVFLLKLLTHIRIDNAINSFQLSSSITKIELKFVLNCAPLDTFRINLLIFFEVVFLNIKHLFYYLGNRLYYLRRFYFFKRYKIIHWSSLKKKLIKFKNKIKMELLVKWNEINL